MVKRYILILTVLILSACSSKPAEITFGDNPSEDLQKNAKQIKALPPGDQVLLSSYFVNVDTNHQKGARHPAAGKTLSQVMEDAKAWRASQSVAATAERRLAEEAKAKTATMDTERKFLLDKALSIVNISLIKRTVEPTSADAKPAERAVRLDYDIRNNGGKTIIAIKGKAVYKDPSGKTIFEHAFKSDKTIAAGNHVTVEMNFRASPDSRDMMNFASAEDGKFSFVFEPEILILEGGETLTIPQKPAT